MGFISYNLKYYSNQLKEIESSIVTEETIYRVKQLLKMIDDLLDEGYTELYEKLEETYQGVTRLRKYLSENKEEPFELHNIASKKLNVVYEQDEMELTEAIYNVSKKAECVENKSEDAFLYELISFCKWIGYEKNTAYIFLLRDTLLPYIYYESKGRNNIYPWLLGRKALESMVGKRGVDDDIRAAIIDALEYEYYGEFLDIVKSDIRERLYKYPEIKETLSEMLSEIKEEKIMVVESGCSGTFPMLLMSLDNRIDMRMYTTYPYLAEVYEDKIFTRKYEENRLFETLYSQDLYFQFANLRDGRFYVNKCNSLEVEKRALVEIRAMMEEQYGNKET